MALMREFNGGLKVWKKTNKYSLNQTCKKSLEKNLKDEFENKTNKSRKGHQRKMSCFRQEIFSDEGKEQENEQTSETLVLPSI